MPKYQYACPDCGNEFEATQKFADKALKKCPTCGKRNIYRAIRQVSVAFRGSGFYVNDSKSGDNQKAAKPKVDEKAEVGSEATVETNKNADNKETTTTAETPKTDNTPVESKTESKPEAKPEPKKEKKPKSTD